MTSTFSPLRRLLLAAVPALALGLGACADKDAPRYKLSAGERAWAEAFQQGHIWTFRNTTTGYERRYRVKEVKDKMESNVTKSLSITSYQQVVKVKVIREDSTSFRATGTADDVNMRGYQLLLALEAQSSQDPARLLINWTTGFSVPVGELEQGATAPLLPSFTAANGITYQNVVQLQYTYPTGPFYGPAPAWILRRLYYTKADGIIQFEETGGHVWARQ
ncbi:hypothetical protein EJV47_21730 [Hymenobacter gummosus]|uniref:Lipoprotein n=1 Tax=Hymenobacter gummosus TaxID=1776032 RepID=A0A3S0K2F1_9BACT|nr:hypothetical protein [Hymenobacter gummosus]RTQ46572.1 hypothetical protein EJV47_21730 [Hymenobacter gummosus]